MAVLRMTCCPVQLTYCGQMPRIACVFREEVSLCAVCFYLSKDDSSVNSFINAFPQYCCNKRWKQLDISLGVSYRLAYSEIASLLVRFSVSAAYGIVK
jgi:hypothetical protein